MPLRGNVKTNFFVMFQSFSATFMANSLMDRGRHVNLCEQDADLGFSVNWATASK